MDYLSICAIVRDENTYLPEWIEYHKLLGVEKFYLYDNESRIPLSETLARDVAEGTVIVIPFPGHGAQRAAYTDGAHRHGDKTFWMAFIDVDEFMLPRHGDDLRTFFKDYEEFAGVCLNWRLFGTSGHETRPSGLQIENFLTRVPDQISYNVNVKTIAQPKFLIEPNQNCAGHYWSYTQGQTCVNTEKIPVASHSDNSGSPSDRPAYLNHYYTRSKMEFMEKVARGSSDGNRTNMQIFSEIEGASTLRDDGILRFAPALKAALARRV